MSQNSNLDVLGLYEILTYVDTFQPVTIKDLKRYYKRTSKVGNFQGHFDALIRDGVILDTVSPDLVIMGKLGRPLLQLILESDPHNDFSLSG